MIILGDQSPWVGGLLRWQVLRDAGEETNYFIADLDSPVVKIGDPNSLKSVSGWPAYWALGFRYPWTIDHPEMHRMSGDSVRQGLVAPPGLKYLAGGSDMSEQTLYSQDRNEHVLSALEPLFVEEQQWAKRLGGLLGIPTQADDLLFRAGHGSVRGAAQALASTLGLPEIQSEMKLFEGEGCLSRSSLPANYFWDIRDGRRTPLVEASVGGVVVPKGKALPLEFALRGWELGCTNLPYLDETLHIRDRYFKGVPLKIVRVLFDWDCAAALEALLVELESRKRKRSLRTGQPFNPATLEHVYQLGKEAEAYWRTRPSVITYLMLGGALRARIVREVL